MKWSENYVDFFKSKKRTKTMYIKTTETEYTHKQEKINKG